MERTAEEGTSIRAELNDEKDGLHYAGEMQGCGCMCPKWRGCLKYRPCVGDQAFGTHSRFEWAQASEEGGKSCDG
jgi:hypothetical protein